MNFLNFVTIVGKLKRVKRSGWIVAGIKNPETVAEHSYRLAILGMILAKKYKVDSEKLIKMALIDDLAEALTGDMVVERGERQIIDPKKQYQVEQAAIRKIFANTEDGEEYIRLWQEAQDKKTKEARLLKQLDKLEMVIQALEYEGQVDSKNLDEFWVNTKKHLEDPDLKNIFEELLKLRAK